MTTEERKLKNKIAELEREVESLRLRISMLEARPPIIPLPAPSPAPWTPNPWYSPTIRDGNIGKTLC